MFHKLISKFDFIYKHISAINNTLPLMHFENLRSLKNNVKEKKDDIRSF